MRIKKTTVIKIMGRIFILTGFFMIPPMIVSLIFGETAIAGDFAVTVILSLLTGCIIVHLFPGEIGLLHVRDGFLIVSLAWILVSLISSVPYLMSGSANSFADAFFESCSGLSTTGSTVIEDVEILPAGILFWRSFTHWIGGMGILVFAVALMPSLGIGGQNIVASEAPGPTLDKLTPRLTDTARTLVCVYLLLSFTEFILLLMGGMSVYDSMIHTFGTVGTGGFSDYNNSVGHFDSSFISIVITVFMLLSGMNFNLYYLFLKKGFSVWYKDTEFRFYIGVFALSALFIFMVVNIASDGTDVRGTAVDATFQTASILTTTGYATCDYERWPAVCRTVILFLMFIGGCSSSTAGGIKAIRIVVLLKMLRRGIAVRLHPDSVYPIKANGRIISPEVASAISSQLFLYILLVFAGAFLISFENMDLTTCLSAVITCIGNVGPGLGMVGPAETFAFMTGFSKIVLSVLMLAGRLELYTLIILINPRYWNYER
ncbi:MAG: TrkH family potassium uptake protein [Bacillota bacterium]|nr:TrkH family potassium uptake protein [Bacillota bacterium]